MKSFFYILSILMLSTLSIQVKSNPALPSQTVRDSVKVWGNCDMCKKNIETAAKKVQGVQTATWDKNTKILTVTHLEGTKLRDIEQIVANAGYDTRDIKASTDSYNKLASCCQYTRE